MARLKRLALPLGMVGRLLHAPDVPTQAVYVGQATAPWSRWYKTSRWQDLRQRVFLRDMFTCQMPGCGRIVTRKSELVCDHIRPHRGDARLFWDAKNLQTLCRSCHDGDKQREEQKSIHQRGVWD